MKVIEFIERANSTLFSYEIIPPKRGGNINDVFSLIDELIEFEPPFIDLTSRSAEVYYEESPEGVISRHTKRKRPGTIGLSAAIKNRYNVETVPHLLCMGFTKQETEDALIELNYLGIDNVLAVRGDELRKQNPNDGKTYNEYAIDLVKQIMDINRGEYLEEIENAFPANFCVGVSGYPEKHFEAPNMATDIKHLKTKVDSGADYIVTQMFYDNRYYFKFVEECRAAGIDVPIVPGLKILSRKSHLKSIPRNFFIDLPEELSNAVTNAETPQEVRGIGVDWALKQCQELISRKVPCIHFYIMSSAKEVAHVVSEIK